MTNPVSTTIPLTISPGPATRVQSQMQAGTLIVNNDPVNAVWVSENSSVVPNYGWKLAAGGSMVWQIQGSECWAVVDTGVSTGVPIIIGNAISDVQDPVAVGVAVATQLLAQGIPSVFLGKQILVSQLTPANGMSITQGGLAQYASVVIVLANLKNIGVVEYEWWQGGIIGQRVHSNTIQQEYIGGSGSDGQYSLELPVKADTLVISFMPATAPNAIDVQLFATNRLIPYDRANVWETTASSPVEKKLSLTQTTVVGTEYLIGTFKCLGSRTRARLQAQCGGTFGYSQTDLLGNQATVFFDSTHAAAFDITTDILLPPGNLAIMFRASTVVTNAVISVEIIQQVLGV